MFESVEIYLLKGNCLCVMSTQKMVIHRLQAPALSHTLYLYFLCRAGYLTLFGGEQNNNGTDPSKVYEEYRKFDGLLTKMARSTLKPGNGTLTTLRMSR